ncbi:MAG: hypothetical protein WA138_04875 [Parvibaculum sp.]
MNRSSSSYLRQILALCFVLAGLLTFAEQAHCLTMTPDFGPTHAMGHEAGSRHQMATEEHDCHHQSSRLAHADWTFLQQPNGTTPVPLLTTSPVHFGQTLLVNAHPTDLVASTRRPPPENGRASFPSVLATTGRLLI